MRCSECGGSKVARSAVGLDSEFGKISTHSYRSGNECAVSVPNSMVAFNEAIVEATHDLVCAYKPNIAFYEEQGDEGFAALHRTIRTIHAIAPNVPVILDAKRADIGSTNIGYVRMAFDYLGVDAITVHPYLGAEALKPFLDREDKGIIVLCRTSNPGAGEFQDLMVKCPLAHLEFPSPEWPFYQHVAYRVMKYWNKNGNCAVVVGATYPDELREVREIVGDMPILIPGIGTQGGDVEKTVTAGKNSRGQGMIINSSRGIIFASDGENFAVAARREANKLRAAINQHLRAT